MPTLASHRKSRSRTGVRSSSPALGFTTAALASVTLLSTQSANAAPHEPTPSVEEVQKRVDSLYRQAESATQQYDKAKEDTAKQRASVDRMLDDVAKRADKLNDARAELGGFAAAQYREGAVTATAALMFSDSPQDYFEQSQLMNRVTDRQQAAVTEYQTQQAAAAKERARAAKSLESLTASQDSLRTSKQDVQQKLGSARTLLSKLTAEEKARLAALERKRQEEARDKAKAAAAAAAEKAKEQEKTEKAAGSTGTANTGTSTGTSTGTADSSYAAKTAKVLEFARAQIGKPYVWGATGPSSYDCSGLTQAAWKAAGVDLPRTTYDQVNAGTRIATDDLLPGDLVFFYDDISHVGIYIGDGMMIHAPHTGANVREESIYYMPIYGSVRPA
jgi:cell wall-associated NlpC family hydrolase